MYWKGYREKWVGFGKPQSVLQHWSSFLAHTLGIVLLLGVHRRDSHLTFGMQTIPALTSGVVVKGLVPGSGAIYMGK